MIFSRHIRKFAALATVLGLLLSQFMVAAYACPQVANALDLQTEANASNPPCHQGTEAQDSLCKAHCQDGQKNVPAAQAPALDFVVAFVVRMPAPLPALQIAYAAAGDISTAHHSPPILLRNACFRI